MIFFLKSLYPFSTISKHSDSLTTVEMDCHTLSSTLCLHMLIYDICSSIIVGNTSLFINPEISVLPINP